MHNPAVVTGTNIFIFDILRESGDISARCHPRQDHRIGSTHRLPRAFRGDAG